MKLVVEGVMGGTLPWGLVFCGIGIAIMIEILGLPILPVAIGLYLPIHLSTPIFIGGMLRWFFESRKSCKSEDDRKETIDRGILYSSGMIAGEGLIGILLAVFAVIPVSKKENLSDIINLNGVLGNIGGTVFFLVILASIVFFATRRGKKRA